MKMNKAREQLIKMYIDSLEENKLPWKKGWDDTYSVHHFNPVSKTNYRGVNNSLLSIISAVRGYKDPRWMTFNQIKEKDWELVDAKGQGVPIEFWSVYDIANKTTISLSEYNAIIKNQPDRKDDFRVMDRIYHVFNATHIKGIPEFVLEEQPKKVMNPSPFIDNLIRNMGVTYHEQGNRAFYSPSIDTVVVPESPQFHNEYKYNSTRLHELCHATGHSSRLNRKIQNTFGTQSYAKEELRAEISASFIAQDMNLDSSQMDLDDHKAYIQSWISTLRKEPNELFKAIKDAENICDYVLETGEIEKFRLQESGEVINEPKVISLEKFLAQKGLSFPVSDYMLDKSKIPHGLTNRQWSLFEKDSYESINEYHEMRKEAIKEYDRLVKEGRIRPQTSIERSIEVANGNPENEATLAARRMLAKRGIDWYTGNEITSNLEEPRYFIDMDGTTVHFNNTIPSLDILFEPGYYRNLLPQEKIVELTKELLKQAPGQVYILSAKVDSPYAAQEKMEWLKEYIHEIPEENIILTPYGKPKYDYVPGGIHNKDVLLDDYTDHLIEWREKGGKPVKLINNINASKQRWQGASISYLDDPNKTITVLHEAANDPNIHLYHGSPNLFDTFSAQKVGSSSGTAQGFGYYLTPSMELAKTYANTRHLYDVSFTPNKQLMLDELTFDYKQMNDLLSHLGDETLNYLVSDYSNVDTNGLEPIKEQYINHLLESSNSDMELIGSLINQSGEIEKILLACNEEGYTHAISEVDNETIYTILSSKNLKIDTIYDIHEDGSITLNEKSQVQKPVYKIDANYKNADLLSIKEQLTKVNQVFSTIIEEPTKYSNVVINFQIDDEYILKNEKIPIEYLVKNQDAIHQNDPNALLKIIHERAEKNIIKGVDVNEDKLHKFSKLDTLLEKMMEVFVIEEKFSVAIGHAL